MVRTVITFIFSFIFSSQIWADNLLNKNQFNALSEQPLITLIANKTEKGKSLEFVWRGQTYYTDGKQRKLKGQVYFRVFDNKQLKKNEHWPKRAVQGSPKSGDAFTSIINAIRKTGAQTQNLEEKKEAKINKIDEERKKIRKKSKNKTR